MMFGPQDAFIQVSTIYNGYLVHYQVAVARNHVKVRTVDGLRKDLKEALKGEVEKELGLPRTPVPAYTIDMRSVYCAGKDDIAKVIQDAVLEQETIKRMKDEGKLTTGFQYFAGGNMNEYVSSADLAVGDPPAEPAEIS